jgi:hypothetical protein
MAKIKCALNNRGKNKQKPQILATGWRNGWLTPQELAEWVGKGYAWCGTHLADGKRAAANARGSNAIVFDFDGEIQLDTWWACPLVQQWCCVTYTSASSTPEVNRFRAVLMLDGIPLGSAWEHKAVYKYLADQLQAALKLTFKDACGNKPERLWYGNTATELRFNDDACVPASVISGIEIPDEPTFNPISSEGITNLDIQRCIWLLENFLRPSEEGEYNEYYVPVMFACASIGDVIANAWITWVSKGHHGNKPENMDPRLKWRGSKRTFGPASIYKLAKQQDPTWARQLPFDLQFSNNRHATQTLDTILATHLRCMPKNIFTR